MCILLLEPVWLPSSLNGPWCCPDMVHQDLKVKWHRASYEDI